MIGPGDGEVTDEFQVSVWAAGRIYWERNKREGHVFIGNVID